MKRHEPYGAQQENPLRSAISEGVVRVSLKDLAKPSKINGLQAASKVFYLLLFVLCQKSSDGVIYWIGCI